MKKLNFFKIDFEILLNKTQNLLTKAAYEDMDLQHFTDFVASVFFFFLFFSFFFFSDWRSISLT